MTGATYAHETARAFLADHHRLLIGGKWRDAEAGATLDVINPATGAVIATIARGGAGDVALAVAAARSSFDKRSWRGLDPSERTRILLRYADLIAARAEEIARIEVYDNGMPLWLAEAVVASATSGLRYAAMVAATIPDTNVSGIVSSDAMPLHSYTTSGPIGVVGLITPWNGPAAAFLIKVAPALAAGCSCVVKPAEDTSLTALLLARLASEAGVPDGVLNVITGLGSEAGQALVDHPDVDKISFTGSTATGKHIVRSAAGNLKRVSLELGGKSPSIIFDDADLEAAIPAAAMGIFLNSGQVCVAGSRIFAHRKVYDAVVAGIAAFGRSMRLGDGFAAGTQLGPVVSDIQRTRIMTFLDESRDAGVDVVSGGVVADGPGFFVEPTVLTNVGRDMRIAREEVFGPVAIVTLFDDIGEVVEVANDTRYGLAAGIFTQSLKRAHQMVDALQAGNIWVNCYGITHPMLPFGGFKESGWGREFGADGLAAYREKKSVAISLG